MNVVESPGRCFGAIDPRPHLRDIQIDLEYPFLAPNLLNQDREIGFDPFPQLGLRTPGEAVLCGLLADSAASADWTAVEKMLLLHPPDFLIVEPVVLEKPLVFSSDDGVDHLIGDFFYRRPFILHGDALSADGMKGSFQHQRSIRDGNPFEQKYQQNAEQYSSCRYVNKDDADKFLFHRSLFHYCALRIQYDLGIVIDKRRPEHILVYCSNRFVQRLREPVAIGIHQAAAAPDSV